ncbi:MAG: hypothetical protein KDK99_01230 [Verrucomicrobiales bacterium]|nr:hypothetical protein [Verrucomicrobiales bacterium]
MSSAQSASISEGGAEPLTGRVRRHGARAAVAIVGAAAVGAGLILPLVKIPVVGTVRFSETALGGADLAVGCMIALSVAALALPWLRKWRPLGAAVALLSLGILGGTCVAIYRQAMERVLEFADLSGTGELDSGVQRVLDQMQWGSGLVFLVLGSGLTLLAWSWPHRH